MVESVWQSVAIGLVMACCGYADNASQYTLEKQGGTESENLARVLVEIRDLAASDTRMPVRVIVTASDGSHPDGSGHGVYADGRFFADGHFEVVVPRGQTSIDLRSGPNYVPLMIQEDFAGGQAYRISVSLHRWFSPEARGWYCGDNHVHALHDSQAKVMASLDIQLPFVGDAWWYPKNLYWQMAVDFGQGVQQIGGGWDGAKSNFKPAN